MAHKGAGERWPRELGTASQVGCRGRSSALREQSQQHSAELPWARMRGSDAKYSTFPSVAVWLQLASHEDSGRMRLRDLGGPCRRLTRSQSGGPGRTIFFRSGQVI